MNVKEIYKAGSSGFMNRLSANLKISLDGGMINQTDFESFFLMALWTFQQTRNMVETTSNGSIKDFARDLSNDVSSLIENVPLAVGSFSEVQSAAQDYFEAMEDMWTFRAKS